MPLGDIGEYHAWIEREAPTVAARRSARVFLVGLATTPWQAPSVPVADLSEQPDFEVRTVALDVPDEKPVRLWYRHIYATARIEVIAVTNQ